MYLNMHLCLKKLELMLKAKICNKLEKKQDKSEVFLNIKIIIEELVPRIK